MSTTPDQNSTTPGNPPSPPPVELYPMADIRFVLVRIGELGSKVDRLIDDVGKQGDKITEVREKITFVKGAIWVFSTLFVVFMAIFGAYLSGKLQIKIR